MHGKNQEIAINQKGFSLVEMAIVVIIAGFIFAPLMAVFIQKDRDDRRVENAENDELIVKSILFFAKRNGRLPCPAAANRAPDLHDNFGRENFEDNNCPAGTGYLPVADLGIPFEMAANSYGWKYRYAVTPNMARRNSGFRLNQAPGLTVNGQAVPFVLINPGEDGKGSESMDGITNALGCAGGADATNCGNDTAYTDRLPSTNLDPLDGDYFDDKVSYSLIGETSDLWVPRRSSSMSKNVLSSRASGNIGIGEEEPSEKLHVDGNVKIERGDITVNGVIDVDGNMNVTAGDLEVEVDPAQTDPSLDNGTFQAKTFSVGN